MATKKIEIPVGGALMATEVAVNIQAVTVDQVLKVYSGKDGKCACGCSGRYYVTPEGRAAATKDRGYAYADRDVSAAMVLKVLRLVQAALATLPEASQRDDGGIFEAAVGARVYRVYLSAAAQMASLRAGLGLGAEAAS